VVRHYQNGGWLVTIDPQTGNKSRRLVDAAHPLPVFPESLDLKVTDYCNAGCAFCHENSTVQGKHADLAETQESLASLPAGTEIAIGGGDPLSWPHLDAFLTWCAARGLFANITVNGLHMRRPATMLRLSNLQASDLIHGIGVSAITSGFFCDAFGIDRASLTQYGLKQIVGHLILGRAILSYRYHSEYQADGCEMMPSYLLLGFKDFGRGVAYREKHRVETDQGLLRKWLLAMRAAGVRVSFDNLALEQANVKGLVDPRAWDGLHMGPDGMFTMFVDAVRQEWAVSSTTPRRDRISWNKEGLGEFFARTTRAFS
jgi:hypothetical protein